MRFWRCMWRAVELTYDRNCLAIAKGASYSGLLALFPVITVTATLLVQAKARPVVDVLSHFLSEILPPGAEELVLARFVVRGEKPVGLLVVATLLALQAASGLMMSLMEGFNSVYGVKGRGWMAQRAMSALLVISAVLPAVGASLLILFGSQSERTFIQWLRGATLEGVPIAQGVLLLGQIARLVVALGTIVLVTALLYRLGPNRPQRWRNVWPGAMVATVLWLPATLGFSWYVRNLADYNVMYGSIGTVIALLAWLYLMAVIACIGCAYNAVTETVE